MVEKVDEVIEKICERIIEDCSRQTVRYEKERAGRNNPARY